MGKRWAPIEAAGGAEMGKKWAPIEAGDGAGEASLFLLPLSAPPCSKETRKEAAEGAGEAAPTGPSSLY